MISNLDYIIKLEIIGETDAIPHIKVLSNFKLEELYCECVDYRKEDNTLKFNLAYQRLLNELNYRKDKQISQEQFSVLSQNATEQHGGQ